MKTKKNRSWIWSIMAGIMFIISGALHIFRLKLFISGTLLIIVGILQFPIAWAQAKLGEERNGK